MTKLVALCENMAMRLWSENYIEESWADCQCVVLSLIVNLIWSCSFIYLNIQWSLHKIIYALLVHAEYNGT